jgi:hypothetical protein
MLAKEKSAQVFLGGLVVAYAKDHPEDYDVPEALFLVLRLVRYGCVAYWFNGTSLTADSEKEDVIVQGAGRILRQRYAASPWTKKAAPFAGGR